VLDDLQTGKVTRSATSSRAFVDFPLWKFRAETPAPPPPNAFGRDADRVMVCTFSGITHYETEI